MTTEKLKNKLDELCSLPNETEWVEFKQAKTDYDSDKIGKYFSALSNEANLNSKDSAWLIFGVTDKAREIVGTSYREGGGLDGLKSEIANHTNNRITFADIHELPLPAGRVIMFQIPPASKGIPTSWKGHYYGREGESLNALSLEEIERIRDQIKPDWSEQVCPSATLADLDAEATSKARGEYKKKNPHLAGEVDTWDDKIFLNKAKVTVAGQITNAAIILLGKPEAEHFISPSVAKITWVLKDEKNTEKDYEHFYPPFILNVERVLSRIRNLKYRYMPEEKLFPVEVTQYDTWVIREALHNAIAHQDYGLKGRISVVEKPDELVFDNVGSFIPGDVETVIKQDSPPATYRNQLLATAMLNLNMIETVGGGIKKMFKTQAERFFPLPDYDLTRPERVVVKIQGRILDERYTRLLIKNGDLDLSTIMLLDKVQKHATITKDQCRYLRSNRLVDGRYPNVFVTSDVAGTAEERARYIRNKGFDDEHYKNVVVAFIKKFGSATRADIDHLLTDKLPDVMDSSQKRNKIRNLLQVMSKKDEIIENVGSNRKPAWVLHRPSTEKITNSYA